MTAGRAESTYASSGPGREAPAFREADDEVPSIL